MWVDLLKYLRLLQLSNIVYNIVKSISDKGRTVDGKILSEVVVSFVAHDELFKELCKPNTMRIGWHLAQNDSRDDFVADPVGYSDFAANLDDILSHLVQQVHTHRYRPSHLLEVDIPKSGLSVRPGNVLPIEEASLLHAIVYLLAPYLDKKLDEAVYSFRLHTDLKKRIKKRDSIFRESSIKFPFLKRTTIRSISPFEPWYDLWPDFEASASNAITQEGYTHLTKTDISAYFENIDLRLLEIQVTSLLKRDEPKILQVLFRVLQGWTRVTSMGMPIGRGIPQGNEVSLFLGNLYLVPLDQSLKKFCRMHDAKWFRYMDDVKVFTRSDHDARKAVFVINDALRALHLNLQGSKTAILTGVGLKKELDNSEFELVNRAIDLVRKLKPSMPSDRKQITKHLKPLSGFVSRFSRGLPGSVTSLNTKQNRLFRRLMTLYGFCDRPQFSKPAFAAMRHLPDQRILEKSLSYVSRLHYRSHDKTIEQLFGLLESNELPFPYQAAAVLIAITDLHPSRPNRVASRIRAYGLKTNQRDWVIVQKALEAIVVYPYRADFALKLSEKYLKHEHPLVRRAACALLMRSPKDKVRKHLEDLIYHADPGVNRLALYFLQFIRGRNFVEKALGRMNKGRKSDFVFQRSLPQLYATAATEDKNIAELIYNFIARYPDSKSPKICWQRERLIALTKWCL